MSEGEINMNKLGNLIKELSEEDLKQAFNEFSTYSKTGVLGMVTIIREIRNKYAKFIDDNSWDRGCMVTSGEILFEIAKRHYNMKE